MLIESVVSTEVMIDLESIRLIIFPKAPPWPNSTKESTPSLTIYLTLLFQSTQFVICVISYFFISETSVNGFALQLATIGIVGDANCKSLM